MRERDFQISMERQLDSIISGYDKTIKYPSDTLFYYLNKAKDEYTKLLFRIFQANQELSDNIRTLVKTLTYNASNFTVTGKKWETQYPKDYVFALGENVYISIRNNKCNNLIVHESDVLEATIENISSLLNNSLSDHRLRYNQAKPLRLYLDNAIVLYTDGNYGINVYELTYLKKAKDLGKFEDLTKEYTDLPENTHLEIVDLAVQMLVSSITNGNSKETLND